MCRYLQTQQQFHFAVSEHFDVVRDSGQRVQLSNHRLVSVRRPNMIYSDISGDTLNRRFWYDGKTVTMLDKKRNLYASEAAKQDIDTTLDYLVQRYRLHVPLADLLFSNPYKVLTEKVKTGAYMGLHTVDGFKAHHLAFTQENLDWQVWVDAGARPPPLQVVISYKQRPGQPQFQAMLSDWSTGGHVSEALFHFRPPKGAGRIDLVPVGGQPRNLRVPKT